MILDRIAKIREAETILGVNKYWAKAAFLTFALLFAMAGCSDNTGGADLTQPELPATSASRDAAATQPALPATSASKDAAATQPPVIQVVTTTGILADWVKNVGGDHVAVFSLAPAGADPHTFQPGVQDVARVADADLALSVGLGLEDTWLNKLLQNVTSDSSPIIAMGEVVGPLEFGDDEDGHDEDGHDEDGHDEDGHDEDGHDEDGHDEDGHDEDGHDEDGHDEDSHDEDSHDEDSHDEDAHGEDGHDDHGHDEDGHDEDGHDEDSHDEDAHGEDGHDDHGHGAIDPHFWFDPIRVKLAVNDIAARLTALDPDRGDIFNANAAAYNAQLDELHAWTEQQVATVPEERRLLVTSHDSLGYFAKLYGFEIVGVVLSTTTEGEPTPQHLAQLVEKVEENGVPAVFGETTVSERLATAVATEAGVTMVRLHSGSLGAEGSDAETYLEMARENVKRITEALR